MILTGRESAATTRRMMEMKADYLIQNCRDKISYIKKFMQKNSILKDEIGYLGDDLNDLPGMRLCGFIGCPSDACKEVKEKADYVSNICGGHGAVRDIIEFLLQARGEWNDAIAEEYGIGC